MVSKRIVASAIVGFSILAAGLVEAAVLKQTFRNVTFPDNTVGTIRAGSKIVNKAVFTECGYFDAQDNSLGSFGSPDFGTTDPQALEDFCWAHFFERT
jgi:hypothetical protein